MERGNKKQNDMDIRTAIKSIAGQPATNVVVGTVTAISGQTCDVQPLDATAAPLLGIALGLTDKAAISFKPKQGSHVLVLLDSPATGFVIAAADCTLQLNHHAEHGNTCDINKVVERLNAIEEDLNSLKKAFNSWAVTAYDGGAKLKAAAKTWADKSLTKTEISDLENPEIEC